MDLGIRPSIRNIGGCQTRRCSPRMLPVIILPYGEIRSLSLTVLSSDWLLKYSAQPFVRLYKAIHNTGPTILVSATIDMLAIVLFLSAGLHILKHISPFNLLKPKVLIQSTKKHKCALKSIPTTTQAKEQVIESLPYVLVKRCGLDGE
jgi:hypothetical protein